MEDNKEKKKIKWRLNIFDVVIIACALVAAVMIINYAGRSGGGASIIPAGSQQSLTYIIELHGMRYGAADLIRPGDTLIDKVEKRALGTVASVQLKPAMTQSTDNTTGDRIIVEVPGKVDAFITVSAQATVTDSQVSVDGFAIRVGTRVSVNGPVYNGSGFISFVERSGLS